MKSPIRTLTLAALLCAGALSARDAAAQSEEAVEQARKFFEAGKQAYEAGQYEVAAMAFEEAYRLAPRPPIVFSMAQAYRRQYFVDRDPAKLKRAVDLYKEYVREVPQGGRRDDAVQYIAELEPILVRVEEEQRAAGRGPVQAVTPIRTETTQLMISSRTKGARAAVDDAEAMELPIVRDVEPGTHKIRVEAEGYFPEEVEGNAVEGRLVVIEVPLREKPAKVTFSATSGAEVSIDGRPVGTAPLRPVEVAAGKHFLSVTKRGHHPFTREVTLKRGQEVQVKASLERTTQRAVSYWVYGAAVLMLAGGGVTTGLALVHEGNAQEILDKRDVRMQTLTPDELAEYEQERQDRDDYVTASYVLFGGGVALAATATLLYFIDSPRVEAPQSSSSVVVPMVSSSGLGAAWVGRF